MIDELLRTVHVREVFDRLRSGRHICADDGPIFLALRADYGAYRELFGALGFDLVQHDRAFYYFRSNADVGKGAAQLAVFFFILVEAWGDAGKDLEATAFDPVGHTIASLPHFSRESWTRCLAEAGVHGVEQLEEVVRGLERYGFAERVGIESFRFRAPAWRFFELCMEVWQEGEQPAGDGNS